MAKKAAVVRRILPFSRVRKLVVKKAAEFRRCYGENYVRKYIGDWGDLHANAVLLYYKACQEFDPSLGYKFNTFLGKVVFAGLRDVAAKRYREDRRGTRPVPLETDVPCRQPFSLREFRASLSDDGSFVVGLVADPPRGVRRRLLRRKKGGTVVRVLPSSYTKALKQYLAAAGWTPERVGRAFDEIREAL
jgi:hypothetical protein